jgi:oligopeptide transport system permease protein
MNYFLRKIIIFISSIFFILTVSFFLMKIIPGDPFLDEKVIPKEILNSLHKHYGFDQPLYKQYLKYLQGVFKGDLGPSYIYQGMRVQEIIKEGFPISAMLGIEALSLALFFGILFGSLSSLYKGNWQDTSIMAIAIIGISVPSFLMASFLQYLFAIKLKILPIARWTDFSHTILPAIALAATPTAFIARLIRSNMIEVMQQEYIKTAFSKGLSPLYVVFHHALRNAILPVVSYLGPVSAQILTGSFIIEKIFAIPGLGSWLIMSISNRDYTVILGVTLFFSVILISIVFLVDILYGFIDPRIKIRKSKSL